MRSARLTGQVIALAAVAVLLGILIWHLTHRPAPPKIGAPAPAFSLDRLDGSGKLDLASLRGHPVVLNFWASWCGPCKREAPALEQLWHRYRAQGVVFVGVDSNDAVGQGRRFLQAHDITYTTVNDPNGLVAANRYNVVNMPMTYFIDKAGRLVDEPVLGPVSEKQFADAFRRGVETAIDS